MNCKARTFQHPWSVSQSDSSDCCGSASPERNGLTLQKLVNFSQIAVLEAHCYTYSSFTKLRFVPLNAFPSSVQNLMLVRNGGETSWGTMLFPSGGSLRTLSSSATVWEVYLRNCKESHSICGTSRNSFIKPVHSTSAPLCAQLLIHSNINCCSN